MTDSGCPDGQGVRTMRDRCDFVVIANRLPVDRRDRPDGTVTLKDGKQIQLQDGQMVTLAGELITVGAEPTGIIFASGSTSTTGAVGRPETVNTPATQGKLDPNDPAGMPGQQSRK